MYGILYIYKDPIRSDPIQSIPIISDPIRSNTIRSDPNSRSEGRYAYLADVLLSGAAVTRQCGLLGQEQQHLGHDRLEQLPGLKVQNSKRPGQQFESSKRPGQKKFESQKAAFQKGVQRVCAAGRFEKGPQAVQAGGFGIRQGGKAGADVRTFRGLEDERDVATTGRYLTPRPSLCLCV